MNTRAPITTAVIRMASGMTLGILMIALLGTGGGVGAYAVANGGMGGAMSANSMAQCGAMDASCGQDPATCVQNMNHGTDPNCQSMNMTPEECQTMHAGMSGGMMSGAVSSGSCH